MRRVIKMMLHALIAQAYVRQLTANHVNDGELSIENLTDKLCSTIFKLWPEPRMRSSGRRPGTLRYHTTPQTVARGKLREELLDNQAQLNLLKEKSSQADANAASLQAQAEEAAAKAAVAVAEAEAAKRELNEKLVGSAKIERKMTAVEAKVDAKSKAAIANAAKLGAAAAVGAATFAVAGDAGLAGAGLAEALDATAVRAAEGVAVVTTLGAFAANAAAASAATKSAQLMAEAKAELKTIA